MRKQATYKQMAFDTTVRNPERYIELLQSLKEFEGDILNEENLLEIVSHLYVTGYTTSKQIAINKDTKKEDIKEQVREVNRTRRADGGFPAGYCARFWTYMRTPSELGFVYAQYNEKLKFSEIAKFLIEGKIVEQEAFSVQAIKHNRKSPYRNVSNDFNFFRFILNILINRNNMRLSYDEFIISLFSRDGDVTSFENDVISFKKFLEEDNSKRIYDFLKEKFQIKTKEKTVTQDYPDVVLRVLIISGFVTIRYRGKKFIEINKNKLDYIKKLLKFECTLSEEEKENSEYYFNKLNENSNNFLSFIENNRETDKLDGVKYKKQILKIIQEHEINEKKICKCIKNLMSGSGRPIVVEFKDIPRPLKLEFYISILIALKYGEEFSIKPNYKADHTGKPYSHAPGNKGDIEIYSKNCFWLIEVTLIKNKVQQLNNETTSVIRHLKDKNFSEKYLSFVAPFIHQDTREFYDFCIFKYSRNYVRIKPYSICDFVEITLDRKNFDDMKNYTKNFWEQGCVKTQERAKKTPHPRKV